MKNSDMPAMPQSATKDGYACNYGENSDTQVPTGLTKREMFAMHAMQGITSNEFGNYTGVNWAKDIADESVKLADALLAELEK